MGRDAEENLDSPRHALAPLRLRLSIPIEGNDRRTFSRDVAGNRNDRRSIVDARQNLETISVIASDGDFLQVHGFVGSNHGQLGAVSTKDERRCRHDERRIG
jgi:hypothetical protein